MEFGSVHGEGVYHLRLTWQVQHTQYTQHSQGERFCVLLQAAEPLLAPGCLVIADNAGVFAQVRSQQSTSAWQS